MRHLAWLTLFATILPATSLKAQTLTLRAGRLIQCTLEEPSLSSKTASPGDPILCYLRSAREFGRSAFPRGSYLAGRFSDAKDPGRLAGKGWLKLEFDRLIFPDTDIPVSAKVIAVRRFRVDEEGKILGQGHPSATRSPGSSRSSGRLILSGSPRADRARRFPAKFRWSFASWTTWTSPAPRIRAAAAHPPWRLSRASSRAASNKPAINGKSRRPETPTGVFSKRLFLI